MRLQSVPGDSTRPVTDRVKEAVFNILGNDVADAAMFDLFGGTGSIGLEALSRGASYVRFTEANRNAYNTLKKNIQLTGFEQKSKAVFGDVFGYLHTVPDREFEYIYVAPPQYKRMWQKTMLILDDNDSWLSDDGWIIVQIHPIEREELELVNYSLFDERKYGSTALLFYERKP
jgi:16S rRNA (guanine(966)-N(2))-methyltransferase RsmD